MIDLVCPVCRSLASEVKSEPYVMHYYQHGETGRTCATLHILTGEWYEITKEQYFGYKPESEYCDCKMFGYSPVSDECRNCGKKPRPTPLAPDAVPAGDTGAIKS